MRGQVQVDTKEAKKSLLQTFQRKRKSKLSSVQKVFKNTEREKKKTEKYMAHQKKTSHSQKEKKKAKREERARENNKL